MKTKLITRTRYFVPIAPETVVCNITVEMNLDNMPELRAMLGLPRVKKMLGRKNMVVTSDKNIVMNVMGIAKKHPDDKKYSYEYGCHLAEDRAELKALRKARSFYKWFVCDYMTNIVCRVNEHVISLNKVDAIMSKNLDEFTTKEL